MARLVDKKMQEVTQDEYAELTSMIQHYVTVEINTESVTIKSGTHRGYVVGYIDVCPYGHQRTKYFFDKSILD